MTKAAGMVISDHTSGLIDHFFAVSMNSGVLDRVLSEDRVNDTAVDCIEFRPAGIFFALAALAHEWRATYMVNGRGNFNHSERVFR